MWVMNIVFVLMAVRDINRHYKTIVGILIEWKLFQVCISVYVFLTNSHVYLKMKYQSTFFLI